MLYQKVFIQHVLYVRHWSRDWGYRNEQDSYYSQGVIFLVCSMGRRYTVNIKTNEIVSFTNKCYKEESSWGQSVVLARLVREGLSGKVTFVWGLMVRKRQSSKIWRKSFLRRRNNKWKSPNFVIGFTGLLIY